MAWLTYRTDFRYKKLLVAAIGLSFFFPGFILAMAWVILGSPGGIFNSILSDLLHIDSVQFDIYSVTGIIWIQVLHITPFAFFTRARAAVQHGFKPGGSGLCLRCEPLAGRPPGDIAADALSRSVQSAAVFRAVDRTVRHPGSGRHSRSRQHPGDRAVSAHQLLAAEYRPGRRGRAGHERGDGAFDLRPAPRGASAQRTHRERPRLSAAPAQPGALARGGHGRSACSTRC